MYKCHLCDLPSTKLNVILTLHWKKHCSDSYSKQQYKVDLLNANGRVQPMCRACNKPTTIAKGESEYSKIHKACYLKELSAKKGSKNSNYSDAQKELNCPECNKKIVRFRVHYSQNLASFCSTSCAQTFYSRPENHTDAIKERIINNTKMVKERWKDDDYRSKMAKVREGMFKDGMSQLEKDFYKNVQKIHQHAEGNKAIDFYTWDIFIPSINKAIEVHGAYWHNLPKGRSLDIRKYKFMKNNRPQYSLAYVWSQEIAATNDIDKLVNMVINEPYRVTIITGAKAAGKTKLCNDLSQTFNIIDENSDLLDSYEKLTPYFDKHILIESHNPVSLFKDLINKGIRVRSAAILADFATVLPRIKKKEIGMRLLESLEYFESNKSKYFNFYGNYQEVKDFLLSNRPF